MLSSLWEILFELFGWLVEDMNVYNGNLSKQHISLEKVSATMKPYSMIILTNSA